MNERVKLREVMELTGFSRATVDRVVNRRGGIHPKTEQSVRAAIDRLSGKPTVGASDERSNRAPTTVDAVLRLDRGLIDQVVTIARERALPIQIEDVCGKSEADIYDAVKQSCRTDRPLIVAVKNHAPLIEELYRARRRGKRVIAAVSDLVPEARDAYVGLDHRRAGQTAAYLFGYGIGKRPAKVGVVLGDAAFRCHEDREIGFRSTLRTLSSNIVVTDVVKGDDSTDQTRTAVRGLLAAHPDLDGIYNVAGGNDGLVEAIAEKGLSERITVICHEVNAITTPLMRRGLLHFLLSSNADALLQSAFDAARQAETGSGPADRIIDFQISTPFNLPLI